MVGSSITLLNCLLCGVPYRDGVPPIFFSGSGNLLIAFEFSIHLQGIVRFGIGNI